MINEEYTNTIHGDLIERDVAYDKIAEQEGGNYVDMDVVGKGLEATPVVIPAEEEENDRERISHSSRNQPQRTVEDARKP